MVCLGAHYCVQLLPEVIVFFLLFESKLKSIESKLKSIQNKFKSIESKFKSIESKLKSI